ncbi:MAG: diphthamide biosynthesis enzyme Dph2 [Methanomicrobia archaeon]|nr:diphthamide biosynthesis enzyme Dph2 [Methanomicrobia archaeon]
MEQRSYEFELDRIAALIRERGATRVGLQLPDGLTSVAVSIADEIVQETGAEVIISGNSCYGACDIDEKLECMVELLFHFGHSSALFAQRRILPAIRDATTGLRPDENVIFIELRSTIDVKPVVEKAAAEIIGECVGLVATIQHVHELESAIEVLKQAGKAASISKSLRLDAAPGLVLGCEFGAARAVRCDEVLFIGSGGFHPAGIALYTGKRVIAADPFTRQVRVFEPDELRKKRYMVIARALDAQSFGVLVGTKSGQYKLADALAVQRTALAKGRNAYVIALDEICEEKLLGYAVDAFVNTACPRLVEDLVAFKKPVLTIAEFEVVLGERSWDELWP